MAKILTPLAPNVPIVDDNKNPTPYFQRILQELTEAKINASLIDALGGDPGGDRVLVWDDSTNSLTFMTTSEVLDFIGSEAHGDILYRDSTGWSLLPAGADGDVLTTHGAGADPTWETPSGGGGSTILYDGTSTNWVVDPGAGGTDIATINLAASAVARTYLVNAFVSFSGAHAIDAVIRLDSTNQHNTLRYADGGDRTFYIHCGPVVVTVPGDSAAHALHLRSADVGAVGAITIEDRWISAIQIT